MKTERRHELQNNELAFFLTRFMEKYRSQAGLFGGIALLGVAAWLAMSYMSSAAEQANAGSWAAYFQATESRGGDERQFNAVADAYGDTKAGHWAKFSAATRVLARATESTFINREDAKAKLKVAQAQLEELVNVKDELLRPRAMLALAQTLESLGALGGTESLDLAAKQFEKIVAEFPNTEIARTAAIQLERLKANQEDGWYTWFASQEPAVDPLSSGSGLFDGIGDTPSDPNVEVPAVPGVGSLIRPDGADAASPIDIVAPENESGDPLTDDFDFGAAGVDVSEDIETILPETDGVIGDVLEGTDAGQDGTDTDPVDIDLDDVDVEPDAGIEVDADAESTDATPETPDGDTQP